MRIIRLAVFCEEYWNKGLIYTQNLMPLKKMADKSDSILELVSFTSIYHYIFNYKEIKSFSRLLKEEGIKVYNYPTLYIPTRYMITRWFMKPFYNLNVWPYIKYLNKKDRSNDVIYDLRSYEVSLGFLDFYKNKNALFFDTRTDWIEENINAGNFKKGCHSVRFWNKIEERMIRTFKKTFVISDIFKNNLIEKYGNDIEDKIEVIYNPIDYKNFDREKEKHSGKTFLYTGSLGQWNRLENYLGFFKDYHSINLDSNLIICTSTAESKVNAVLLRPEYDVIRDKISVYYNVKFEDLPTYYAKCDYGLQLMNKKDSRVGVKFIEYVAAGVVPIVSTNVRGAAFLVEKYGIGLVVCGNETPDEIAVKIEKAGRIEKSKESYLKFKSQTDLNSISTKLEEVFCHK